MSFTPKVPVQQPIPLLTGANSPNQSAIMKMNNMNNTQAGLNKAAQGGKRKKIGGNGKMLEIQPTSTANMNLNPLLKNVATSDINAQVYGQYDKGAFKMGGSKRRRRTNKRTKRRRHKKTRRNRR
jgi:hypothetical protein